MSIWGKIIGGTAGFALGGPLGALLGTAAGHVVDRLHAKGSLESARQGGSYKGPWGNGGGGTGDADPRQVAFATGVIVLAAKMAKVDGHVTRDEINAFKRAFNVQPHEMPEVGRIFDQARTSADGYEPYARQLAVLFAGERAMLEDILEALFQIALADGALHPAEQAYLRNIARIFGFADIEFDRVHQGNIHPQDCDPYGQIGMPRDASNDDLKAAYRKLIRENHPDTLIAKGMPEEFVTLATEKMARINAAWDQISKERNMR
ncbi:TerB family tellurite resistance protein [Thalassospira sp.]|uniref:TerB family tellurite resistance protein n=1 Tax=Thalassospira sp. TaxID=1912094 RepID=UPI002735C42F|nr:TerB family tellurite resistance protein [Thalassospira sp.]MDP2698647.1 TerB family tellurite resistance protein [Thalassospira sp.]